MMLYIGLYCIYWILVRLTLVSMTYATATDFAHHLLQIGKMRIDSTWVGIIMQDLNCQR
jgi:hypothetical protein